MKVSKVLYWGRHNLVTRLVMKDMDSTLAWRITRHASDRFFIQ
ncbi:hypothetical protein [Acaryochloris sp. IP29b_bin.137]|nr:hypothetical protein [Acaryochloris sp. IP29b_bin.137]